MGNVRKGFRVIEDVDIYQYPVEKDSFQPTKTTQLTIGDLHGNAIKFLYFLIRQNVLDLKNSSDYAALVSIYNKKAEVLTQADLDNFNRIINEAKIINPALIRIIGDELADRGSNDYFTLKIFEKLGAENVPVEVLLSNHSVEFLWSYERKLKEFTSPRIGFGRQDNSLQNLGILLNNPSLFDQRQKVVKIVDNYYLKNLKLISYSLNNNKITLYTHAPNGYSIIGRLVEGLLNFNYNDKKIISYSDNSVEELAHVIDQINIEFQKIVKENRVSELCGISEDATPRKGLNPFFDVMWNRVTDSDGNFNYNDDFISAKNGFNIEYCHGHDGANALNREDIPNHVLMLDNKIGKGPQSNNPRGEYTVYINDSSFKHDLRVIKQTAFEEKPFFDQPVIRAGLYGTAVSFGIVALAGIALSIYIGVIIASGGAGLASLPLIGAALAGTAPILGPAIGLIASAIAVGLSGFIFGSIVGGIKEIFFSETTPKINRKPEKFSNDVLPSQVPNPEDFSKLPLSLRAQENAKMMIPDLTNKPKNKFTEFQAAYKSPEPSTEINKGSQSGAVDFTKIVEGKIRNPFRGQGQAGGFSKKR